MTPAGVLLLALACVGVVVACVTGSVLLSRGVAVLRTDREPAARRVCVALLLGLIAAYASVFVSGGDGSNAQVFAQSGAQRWIAGPALYVLFAGVLLLDRRRPAPLQLALPRFLGTATGLLVMLALATASAGLLAGTTAVSLTAQGIALTVGFAVFLLAGALSGRWDSGSERFFVGLLVAVTAAVLVTGRGPGSLPALVVPVMAALVASGLLAAMLSQVARLASIGIGVGVVVWQYVLTTTSTDPSDGLLLQMVLCFTVVVLAALPSSARPIAGVIAAVAILAALATSPLPQVMTGGRAEDPDLTISERGYETQQVWRTISASPLTLVFGEGPGGSVDLTQAPDRATLAASGRDLRAVPSVHLLTSHVLMKFGLCGLAWLAAMLALLIRLTVGELRASRPSVFGVLLLCLAWSGLAAAVPAATFFFSNPLCALSIGLLLARRLTASNDQWPVLASRHRLRVA